MNRLLFSFFTVLCVSVAQIANADCPEPAVDGIQPCDDVIVTAFERAASNTLGDDGPDLGSFGEGRPSVTIPARFPCALLGAIGQVESTWRQFTASGTCGGTGPTVISFDCGYGVMQITSGMDGTGGFDPPSVARDTVYNIGTGARILGQKWHSTPYVGVNNPDLIECWYYAVWAYNGFSYINNPNNPRYPAARMPYRTPSGGARSDYPYQEIVWGYLKTPVGDRWPAIDVSYPDKSQICNTEVACFPGNLTMPMPSHTGTCSGSTTIVDAGMPSEDAGVIDAAAPLDAGVPDSSVGEDAGVAPPVRGCQCNLATHTPATSGIAMLVGCLALALARTRNRKRRQ